MNTKRRASRLYVLSSSALLASSLITVAPGIAGATNVGTESGVVGQTCEGFQWKAESILDMDIDHLNVGLDGKAKDYSNSGYVQEVQPALQDGPGIFEINHWYTGVGTNNTATAATTQNWRIPVASDNYIKDATVTVTLPAGATFSVANATGTDAATNTYLKGWGDPYSNYQWHNIDLATATDNGDGTWTVRLGDILPKQAFIFQFSAPVAAGTSLNEPVTASAVLNGIQASGKDDADNPCPPLPDMKPEPSTDLGRCEVEYLGRTVWNKFDSDITDREKYFNSGDGVIVTDEFGEVNNDGWGRNAGLGADAYSNGATRNLRLYGGTHKALDNATWTSEIVQGGQFNGSFTKYNPAGPWTLPNFTADAGFPDQPQQDSPTKVSVHDVNMPVDSWFAYNAGLTFTGDDETPVVIFHRLRGTLPDCDPNVPTPPTDDSSSGVDPIIPIIIGGSIAGGLLSSAGSSGSNTGTQPAPSPSPATPSTPATAKPVPSAQPAPEAKPTPEIPRKRLANTGASVLGVLLAASVAVAAGVFLIRRSRKQG